MELLIWVGIDWGSQSHEVCVVDAAGKVLGTRSFKSSQEGLEALITWLDTLCERERSRASVAIEVPHGPVVETLLDRGFSVYTLNPKQLDRFRDRFNVAGAKDDRLDARVLADSLRTDGKLFRKVELQNPLVIELRQWSRTDHKLKADRVALGNQIRAQLHRYAPHLLDLTEDLAKEWFFELWELAPTPDSTRRLRKGAVKRVLAKHRIRQVTAERVMEVFRQPAVTVAPGVEQASVGYLRLLMEQGRVINRQIRLCQAELERLLGLLQAAPSAEGDAQGQKSEQRDAAILRSMPGVGQVVLGTLLAEAADEISRRNYCRLRSLAGVAPVMQRTGKSKKLVVMRRACSPWLRNAVYQWARVATQHDRASHERYRLLRARGKSPGQALRTVADRLLYVACTLLSRGELFDPKRGLGELKKEKPGKPTKIPA